MIEKLIRKLFGKKQKKQTNVEPKPIYGKVVTQILEKTNKKKDLINDNLTEKEIV